MATPSEDNDDIDKMPGAEKDKPVTLYAIFTSYLNDLLDNRIKHPVIGSTILAFLVYNWKVILLVFFPVSTGNAPSLTFGDRVSSASISISGIILPITFGLLYPLAIPYSSWMYKSIIKKAIIGIKGIKEEERQYSYVQQLRKEIKAKEENLASEKDKVIARNRELGRCKRSQIEFEAQINNQKEVIAKIEEHLKDSTESHAMDALKFLTAQRLIQRKKKIDEEIHQFRMNSDRKYREQHEYDGFEQDFDGHDEEQYYADRQVESENLKEQIQELQQVIDKFKAIAVDADDMERK